MSGKVYLIGGGPGAPDLISLRGLRCLQRSDLIIADNLLPHTYLDDLGITGKQVERPAADASGEKARQQAIGEMMVAAAQEGRIVARLKTGDPFLFGRGWEEVLLLEEHGIPWEVVPGAASMTAVPALAGVPLTTRHTGRSVAFVTGRVAGGDTNKKFPHADTLVIVMAVRVMKELSDRLMAEGWPADTPAAVIERGSHPDERRVRSTLKRIAEESQKAGLGPPALLIIGAAAGEARF